MMRRRGFSLIEAMAVLALIGLALSVGMFSINDVLSNARRTEQAKAAIAQMRKVRADALASSSGAAIEAVPSRGGGVVITTAVVPRKAGASQCDSWQTRGEKVVASTYVLLDVSFPRADNTLCFEAGGYRLLDVDGVTLAPAPLVIDVFPPSAPEPGTLTVQPTGAVGASFDDGIGEGLAATVNITPTPPAEDPSRNVVEPRALEPELPVMDPPPADPTTPAGQPTVDALPAPIGSDPPPPPPPACVVNADCPAGFVCVIPPNTCEPGPVHCTTDFDCPDIELGCNLATSECTKPCNSALCPATPATCGGCQGATSCCTVYGCMCF